MKKSVIIVIGIIYVLAIVVVGFFGLKIKKFDSNIYVQSVEIVNEEIIIQKDSMGQEVKVIMLDLSETNELQLKWVVTPNDATHPEVNFGYDTSSTVGSVDQEGKVTFNKRGVLTVYISSADGSAKSDSVKIIAIG